MKKDGAIIFEVEQKRGIEILVKMKKEERKMTLKKLNNIVDQKIDENEDKIVITFFEIVVKENLSMNELDTVQHLIMQRLENLGYTVYKTGESYSYKEKIQEVKTSELLVALKK